MCGQRTNLMYTSQVLDRTWPLCPRCWDPDGSRHQYEPHPPLDSREGKQVSVLVADDGIVQKFVRYRERLGIVHRLGARYADLLRRRGVLVGKCRCCRAAGPLVETVQDETYGEVHVHRESVASDTVINRTKVFARDGWQCRLCGGRLDERLAYPHPQSPSVDHIVAKALGGLDVSSNLQAAHLRCNVLKGTKAQIPAWRLRYQLTEAR
jgi:5-methylcytosine-specific restriction endonuclease McrA